MTRLSACVLTFSLLLAGCTSVSIQQPKPDRTLELWYKSTLEKVVSLSAQAGLLLEKGKPDEASAAILQGEPLAQRLLAVPNPSLAAVEAASDLDDLYCRMLLSNRQYGWARMIYQKNVARWVNWRPETQASLQRKKAAMAGIVECDRHLGKTLAR